MCLEGFTIIIACSSVLWLHFLDSLRPLPRKIESLTTSLLNKSLVLTKSTPQHIIFALVTEADPQFRQTFLQSWMAQIQNTGEGGPAKRLCERINRTVNCQHTKRLHFRENGAGNDSRSRISEEKERSSERGCGNREQRKIRMEVIMISKGGEE